jgi:hypothetical protein
MVLSLGLLIICFFILLSSSTVYGAASNWTVPTPLFHKSPYFNAWLEPVIPGPTMRWAPQFFNHQVFPKFSEGTQTSHNGVGLRMVHRNSS